MLSYRLHAAGGALTTQFGGLPDPGCEPLDACGVAGSLTRTLSPAHQQLELVAQRVVRHRVSGEQSLRDLHAGRLKLAQVGSPDIAGRLSAAVGFSDATNCSDQVNDDGYSLGATFNRRDHALAFDLVDRADGIDPMRTRCPGPRSGDALRGIALAGGLLPDHALGRRQVSLRLTNSGDFDGFGYQGSRGGALTVDLRLAHIDAGTITATSDGVGQ
jgi:hypothetical protein